MQPDEVSLAREEFREQRRRKRNSTDDKFKKVKKKVDTPTAGVIDPQPEVPTRNFFAPLRKRQMKVMNDHGEDRTDLRGSKQPQAPGSKRDRTPPIILKSPATNLIQLQHQFKGKFEFRNTRTPSVKT
jgi:hypothetical protein